MEQYCELRGIDENGDAVRGKDPGNSYYGSKTPWLRHLHDTGHLQRAQVRVVVLAKGAVLVVGQQEHQVWLAAERGFDWWRRW